MGIILDQKGLKLQEHILSKVRDFPDTLENITQLQSLLGILNYGRNFIKNLSKIEIPWLTKLRKNVIFEWTAEDVALIKQIKENVKTLPDVYLPKTGDKLILETDASEACWGCVLKAIPSNLWYDKEIPLSENGVRPRKNFNTHKITKRRVNLWI